MEKLEKVYTSMRAAGICSMVIGIVILAVGTVVGIMSVVTGCLLLKRKSDVEF